MEVGQRYTAAGANETSLLDGRAGVQQVCDDEIGKVDKADSYVQDGGCAFELGFYSVRRCAEGQEALRQDQDEVHSVLIRCNSCLPAIQQRVRF